MTLSLTERHGLIAPSEFLRIIAETDFPVVVNNKKISYYNVPAAFDIEVSSFYQNGEKKACMYVWQFGILNWVTYGRTWEEFKLFMSVLSTILGLGEKLRLPVYVHNLAYEFQFIRKHFTWDKVFFLDERKPVYAVTNGIEYRCSLKLSSKTLEKVGQDLQKYKVKKLVGDLDYQLVRTPKTPLTEQELGYCENDIRVLLAYIQEKIEVDGDVSVIPMTNTGYVRNLCRKSCFKHYKRYRSLMSVLTLEPSEYRQLKRAFSGGFTHASAIHVNKVLEHIGSFDFTSSYPAVMLSEKFPMSKAHYVDYEMGDDEFQYCLDNYCCLFDIELHNVIPKLGNDHPISKSRCSYLEHEVVDNGRIVAAEVLKTTITEQDYKIYEKFYDWDEIVITNFRYYEKAYLPKDFALAILELYKKKTTLKGIESEEINYMISKNMLNAAYGMAVTDIVRDEIDYVDDEFQSTTPNLSEAIDKYNKGKKRFLFYPWGVWVTAYARANLFDGIINVGYDYVYADTDSIKILHPEKHLDYIEAYNKRIQEKLKAAADFYRIDVSEFSPLNKEGEAKPIGVWDFEGIYDKFKTIGAKRYMRYEYNKKKQKYEYTLTVAGVSKAKAMKYLEETYSDPFEALDENLIIPKEYSGRLTSTYFDVPCDGIITDYLGNVSEYHELSYIHMEPSQYELTMSMEYRAFLDFIQNRKEDSW